MKKLMISLAALTAIGAAVPAAAQTWGYGGGYGGGYGYNNPAYGNDGDFRVQVSNRRYNQIVQRRLQLSDMIARAQRRGEISDYAAQRLRSEVAQVSMRANYSRRGGLTNREAAMAVASLDRIAERLAEVRHAPRYSYGYNSYNGRNSYDGYDNNNGWDGRGW